MRRWAIGQKPASADLEEMAAALRSGGVLLLPTDTIYGLHALAGDSAAVARLGSIKGRDDGKAFVVIGCDIGQLEDLGAVVTPAWRASLEGLWPAPLTGVFALRRPVAASRGNATLAVRVPALDWLRELLALTGPLASTSANRSGEPAVESPDQLARELQDALDGIADAGPLSGEPSTVVDFTADPPLLLREGGAAFSQLVRKTLRKSL